MGAYSRIGAGCIVGAGCVLDECVDLLPGTVVPPGTNLPAFTRYGPTLNTALPDALSRVDRARCGESVSLTTEPAACMHYEDLTPAWRAIREFEIDQIFAKFKRVVPLDTGAAPAASRSKAIKTKLNSLFT